ncbi:ynr018w-like protein [Moniliophthora roreri MCA 2997]|uniref:Ynr018w-like protein n=1 Tax=Moniliophthora roreri (strain MCA 2997) TaxID=1381753 RepID=V2XMX0_MONRO|nr:ynr018w-like protein [Moniliophthora roreri MCA 2997]KAI3616464.1 ynr018w-like protein [Moniliophthora roreri]
MKLDVTEEELRGHRNATIRGAVEGTLAGGAVASAAGLYMQRRWTAFRQLPPSLKVLGGIIVVAPLLTIQAERRGLEFDQAQWTDEGARILTEQEHRDAERWASLSFKDRVSDWASRHEYSIIMGSWALSLAAAGAIISRDKYQTVPQKVVQARMWAQGLTIGILIVAGALKHGQRQGAVKKAEDHSWREVLEQQELERKEDEARLERQKGTAAERRAAWNIQ